MTTYQTSWTVAAPTSACLDAALAAARAGLDASIASPGRPSRRLGRYVVRWTVSFHTGGDPETVHARLLAHARRSPVTVRQRRPVRVRHDLLAGAVSGFTSSGVGPKVALSAAIHRRQCTGSSG